MRRAPFDKRSRVLIVSVVIGAAMLPVIAPAGPTPARQNAGGGGGGGSAGAEADRALERYLEDRGLVDLLAEQLESRIATTAGQDRVDAAERLASIYADQMERAADGAERGALEEKSRALLALVPDADSFDLRLGLLRAAYNRAERLAERWRLRAVGPEMRDEALRSFATIGRELSDIGSRAHRRVEDLERQEESTRESDPELIAEHLALARRRRSLAMYLAGWCETYTAEIAGNPNLAGEAMRRFGWLLNAPPGEPAELARAPLALMRFEHVARSAIGVAICEAVRGNDAEALQWLDLVAGAPDAPAEVRSQLTARRMTILARTGHWYDLTRLVEGIRAAPPASRDHPAPLVPGEARLLAILALEAPASTEELKAATRSLATIAFSDLVARGEQSQVLDLASRYGTAPIGSSGFIAGHVRGLNAYEQARAAHAASGDATRPATTSESIQRYAQAADAFRQALAAGDASKFIAAQGDTSLLLGLSLYYGASGDRAGASRSLAEAAEALFKASLGLADELRAADALLMAIRSLDEAVALGGAGLTDRTARRAEFIALFLARHPEHARAGALLLRQATEGGLGPEEAVAVLMRVPESSPVYFASRAHADRLLYEMYRAADASARDWAALRYADVAEPLLLAERRRAGSGEGEAASAAAARARRLLDALLSVAAPDAPRAERALDALESMIGAGLIDPAPLRDEIEYRRAQIALARGDEKEAERIVDGLAARAGSPGGAGQFASAANRLLLRHAAIQWRSARRSGAPDDRIIETARTVVKQGARAMVGLGAQSPDPGAGASADAGAVALTLDATVAEAAADLWTLAGDRDARDLSIRLHRRVLAAQPTAAGALRRLAALCEDAGDVEGALECWRTLASGYPERSMEWFESRVRVMELLARTDPARARATLTQHKALHPDLGPPPWGARLRALEDALRSDAP